jgi:hypothetical protein
MIDICPDALLAAVIARDHAEKLYLSGILDTGEQNAYRHALWMALMISEFDIDKRDALALGVAHEMDGTAANNEWWSDNSKIDLHNNFVGAQIGVSISQGRQRGIVEPGNEKSEAIHYTYLFTVYADPCPSCLYLEGAN